MVAGTPSKVATLLLCVAPNPLPVMVTVVPIGPLVGVISVTVGWPRMLNCTALLFAPQDWTTNGPLVAAMGTYATTVVSSMYGGVSLLQVVLDACTPLKNKTWL